ncbi:MAG: S9 family peptidase, partial [Gammaproteobacteria bacterium]|nr:S9 family peptidase [Gammaproteobacteria bacterium]
NDSRKNRSTSGAVYDQLFVRHWDGWLDETQSQLFVVTLENGLSKQEEPVPLTAGLNAEVPSRTWGGNEEYAFSPDGRTVYFTARRATPSEPWSTNFDIYSVPAGGGDVVNLTGDNEAWDTRPVPSPDGRHLVYLAMSRPGYEADRFRIMLRDLQSGATRELAPRWDRSASGLAFSDDGNFLFVTAQDVGNKTLWRIDIAGGDPIKVVPRGTVSSFDSAGSRLVFARDSLESPSELFVLEGDDIRQLTDFTGPQLAGVQLGEYEQFSFEGAHGATVYGYVMKPANFVEGESYPVAFLIHGGPQGSFGNHFHYRWNPQTYAGQGFAPVFIDFHGSTGYGQDFTDAIRNDWGGAPLVDLQKGLAAALEKYDFLDGDRACALGASYGGFMVNWIAGNWPDGFQCLVNHDGIFDQRMMYYTTEELWFPEWEHGGPYHENPENYERFNPANFVKNWRTPMLVIHGETDYRVPVTQGIATFTALQRLGVPSRLLYYPDENHWVLNPDNSVQWHSVVNEWLHQHLSMPSSQ